MKKPEVIELIRKSVNSGDKLYPLLNCSSKELIEYIDKQDNIINELKGWFKGYHKSYASCKWYEEDYIEFIEHLENELKGEDKE